MLAVRCNRKIKKRESTTAEDDILVRGESQTPGKGASQGNVQGEKKKQMKQEEGKYFRTNRNRKKDE